MCVLISSRRAVAALLCSLLAHGAAVAQESVNKDLDECIKKERIAITAKGAGIGALGGFAKSMLASNDDKKSSETSKNVLVGAAAGGAIGLAVSYYTAVDRCYKKNPKWIPESKIERTKSYKQTVAELGYKPSMGTIARAKRVAMPETIQPGGVLEITSTFQVMTPNGSETAVTIERKLYAMADGKETVLPFTGKGTEERTVEPGEHSAVDHVPVPADVAAGTAFRIEYLVSADKKPPSTASATVTVK